MIPDRISLVELGQKKLIERKIEYEFEIARLDEAAATETKSSAGDKYETGREMISQSRIVIERNLTEAQVGLDILSRMQLVPQDSIIGFGNLVETNIGWFLLGVSLGELESNAIMVQTISLASPLGQALRGKQVGATISWRLGEVLIRKIVG